jgi:hypothetical protein
LFSAFCLLPSAFHEPSASSQTAVKERLVGSWELVSYEIIAADGTRRPGNYDRGQITYDASGRMSAHLMHSSNKADASPQTDELRATAFRRYLGYYGPFVVDTAGGTVTHIVEGSSNPSWVGPSSCATSSCRRTTRN